ncbi:hypothetical protein PRIPAC_93768 [Pristionchus pacificus]|uniref:ShK domain-containing protein n=1 Tax=Pristionchus pacificus TaxID=54126 RepID=A0A2A6BA44_PRIPA|nr:hypothetical protein PRIPAC_93768 [Pristionchus pacificus]|eukprot:PDM62734.1 ShK domain-containing protein [Pristionchus pacificus]
MRAGAIIIFLVSIDSVTAIDECVDRITSCGVQSNLCNRREYDDLMKYYCKKTCNRDCSPFTLPEIETTCADLTPDCLNKPYICTMPVYNSLAVQFCPKSCNRCA